MAAYYNEFDPKSAAWLRELIKQGHIADGEVDDRSILDVTAGDVSGFTQCHFFAGIGGWSYALRLAGWPDERPVWTGSPPCQPFSEAGKQDGGADERHLAPAFLALVKESRPATLFGEQVSAAIRFGWLDALQADLESFDYACGSVVLGAHSAGAPHIRQRLWFVADAEHTQRGKGSINRNHDHATQAGRIEGASGVGACGTVGDSSMADTNGRNTSAEWQQRIGERGLREADRCTDGAEGTEERAESGMADAGRERIRRDMGAAPVPQVEDEGRRAQGSDRARRGGATSLMGDSDSARPQGCGRHEPVDGAQGRESAKRYDRTTSIWHDAEWLDCIDGKARPVEPGTFPLAHGVSARVGRLRGYGNAIVPQVAAQVIGAYMDTQL